MKTQHLNLPALFVAALITLGSLATLHSQPAFAPASHINGVRVIDLAPVSVRPSATELRQAARSTDADLASALMMPAFDARASTGASLLGAQLAMPYYSFGSKLGHGSKE
jgi:hypothetical protein